MNPHEISSKPKDARLSRIKTVGSYLRAIFILFAAMYGLLGLISWFGAVSEINGGKAVEAKDIFGIFAWSISIFGKAVECWMAYKLFSCYVTEGLFTTTGIRWMRRIGIVNLLIGLSYFLSFLQVDLTSHISDQLKHSPPMQQLRVYFGLGLHYANLDFLAGFVIIFIAWIMNEGRKIQEEQELTV